MAHLGAKHFWSHKKTIETGFKYCYLCKQIYPLNVFGGDKCAKDGLRTTCILCTKKRYRDAQQSPNGKYREYTKRAKQRGQTFLLTKDEFLSFWGMPCFYCASPIETIGIDRIDNNLGYEHGNCVPCCRTCNYLKARFELKTKPPNLDILLKMINLMKTKRGLSTE